jgi:hypothetical protein
LLDDPLDVIGSRYTAGYDLLAVSAISSAGREFSVQPGDVDLDGDVDLADLNLVRNNFGATVEATLPLPGDVYPYDNRVDVRDLNDVRNHFGESLSTVPEPSSVGLALFCALSATLFALSSRLRTHGMS